MSAWTQLFEPGPALILLIALLVPRTAVAAPLNEHDTTNMEYYPVADSTGCYYNFQHYDEGDRIITNEPCLNCTCHNRMLMCYLRVCPFTKAIGQDCKVEKRADQCCPVITCPEVPVHLLTSTTQSSTAVGHPDAYGCSIEGLFYSDGARVPSDPNKPCELCYCIRNKTACVMQECTLKVEGCKPVYQEGVCCPVRYDCEHPEYNLLETTTPKLLTTTTPATTTIAGPVDCLYKGEIYADGALVIKDKPCEHCYCMKGDIVCAVQECSPTPLDKVNCTALPPKEGQCCPDTYECEHMIDEELTTGYSYTTPPSTTFEEVSTVHPVSKIKETEQETLAPETENEIITEQQSGGEYTTVLPKEKEILHEPVTILPAQGQKEQSSELPETAQKEDHEEPIKGGITPHFDETMAVTEGIVDQTQKPESQEQMTEHPEVVPTTVKHTIPSIGDRIDTTATEIPQQEENEIPEEHEFETAGPPKLEEPAHDDVGEHEDEEEYETHSPESGSGASPDQVTESVSTETKTTVTPDHGEDRKPEQDADQKLHEPQIPEQTTEEELLPKPETTTEKELTEQVTPKLSDESGSTKMPGQLEGEEKTSTEESQKEVTHPQQVTESETEVGKETQKALEPEQVTLQKEEGTTEHPHVIQHVTEIAPEIGTGMPHEVEVESTEAPKERVPIEEAEITKGTEIPQKQMPSEGAEVDESTQAPKEESESSKNIETPQEKIPSEEIEEGKVTQIPPQQVEEEGKVTELTPQQVEEEGKVTELPPHQAEEGKVTELPPQQAEEEGKVTELPPQEVEEGGKVTEISPQQVEEESKVTELPQQQAEEEGKGTEITPQQVDQEGKSTEIPPEKVEEEGKVTEISPEQVEEEGKGTGLPPQQGEEDGKVTEISPQQVEEESKVSELPPQQAEEEAQVTEISPPQVQEEAKVTELPSQQSEEGKPTELPQAHVTVEQDKEEKTTTILEVAVTEESKYYTEDGKITEVPGIQATESPIEESKGSEMPQQHVTEQDGEEGKATETPQEHLTTKPVKEVPPEQVTLRPEPEDEATGLPTEAITSGKEKEEEEQGTEHPKEKSVTEPGEAAEVHTTIKPTKETEVTHEVHTQPSTSEEAEEGITTIKPQYVTEPHTGRSSILPEEPVSGVEGEPSIYITPKPVTGITELPEEEPITTEQKKEIEQETELPKEDVTHVPTTGKTQPIEKAEVTELPKELATEISVTESKVTGLPEEEVTESKVIGESTKSLEEHLTVSPSTARQTTETPEELYRKEDESAKPMKEAETQLPETSTEGVEKDRLPEVKGEITDKPLESETEIPAVTGESTKLPEVPLPVESEIPKEHTTEAKEIIATESPEGHVKEQLPEEQISEKVTEKQEHVTSVPFESATEIGETKETELPYDHVTYDQIDTSKPTEPPQAQITEKLGEKATELPTQYTTQPTTDESKETEIPHLPHEHVTKQPTEVIKESDEPQEGFTSELPTEHVTKEPSESETEALEAGQVSKDHMTEKPEVTDLSEKETEHTTKPSEEISPPKEGETLGEHPVKYDETYLSKEPVEQEKTTTQLPEYHTKITEEQEITEHSPIASPAPSVEGETEKSQEGTTESQQVTYPEVGITEHGKAQIPEEEKISASGTEETERGEVTTVKYIPEGELEHSTEAETEKETLTSSMHSVTKLPDEEVSPEQVTQGETTDTPQSDVTKEPAEEGESTEKTQELQPSPEEGTEKLKETEVSYITTESVSEERITTKKPEIDITGHSELEKELGGTTISTPTDTEEPSSAITEQTIYPSLIHDDAEHPEEDDEEEKEEHGIPGEGSCLVDGQTYKNNSNVPPINPCQVSCKCMSSIVQCESVNCTRPPSNLQHCMPVYQGPDSCCPTYSCTVPGVTSMESDSHKVETTTKPSETEKPEGITVIIPSEEGTIRPEGTTPLAREETESPEYILPTEQIPHIIEEEHVTGQFTGLPGSVTEQSPELTTSKDKETETTEKIETVTEAAESEIEKTTEKQTGTKVSVTEAIYEGTTPRTGSEESQTTESLEKQPGSVQTTEYPSGVEQDKIYQSEGEQIPDEGENVIEDHTEHVSKMDTISPTELPKQPVTITSEEIETEKMITTVGESATETGVMYPSTTSSELGHVTKLHQEITTITEQKPEQVPEEENVPGTVTENIEEKETESSISESTTPEGIKAITEGVMKEVSETGTEEIKASTPESTTSLPHEITTLKAEIVPETGTVAVQVHIPVQVTETEAATESDQGVTESGKPSVTEETGTQVPETKKETSKYPEEQVTEGIKFDETGYPSQGGEEEEEEEERPTEHVPQEQVTEVIKSDEAGYPLQGEKEKEEEEKATEHISQEQVTEGTKSDESSYRPEGDEKEETPTEHAPQEEVTEGIKSDETLKEEQKPSQHVSQEQTTELTPKEPVSEVTEVYVTEGVTTRSEITTELPEGTEKETMEVVTEPVEKQKMPESVSHVTEKHEETVTEISHTPEQVSESLKEVTIPSETEMPSVPSEVTSEQPQQVPSEHIPTDQPIPEVSEKEITKEKEEEGTLAQTTLVPEKVAPTEEMPQHVPGEGEEEEGEQEGRHTTPSYGAVDTDIGAVTEKETEKPSTLSSPTEVPAHGEGVSEAVTDVSQPTEKEGEPAIQTTSKTLEEHITEYPEKETEPSISTAPSHTLGGISTEGTTEPAPELEGTTIPPTEEEKHVPEKVPPIMQEPIPETEEPVEPATTVPTEHKPTILQEGVTESAASEASTIPSLPPVTEKAEEGAEVIPEAESAETETKAPLPSEEEKSTEPEVTAVPEEHITGQPEKQIPEIGETTPSAETELPTRQPIEGDVEVTFATTEKSLPVPTTVQPAVGVEQATERQPGIPGEGEESVEPIKPSVQTTTEAVLEGKPEEAFTSPTLTETPSTTQSPQVDASSERLPEPFTSGPSEVVTTAKSMPGELSTSAPSTMLTSSTTLPPLHHDIPEETEEHGQEEEDYGEEDQSAFGPGTCRYGGKVYVSAQQIPRDDPCDFCFCFRSDIICLQQSCPPPIPRCHEEPIRGFCCPRYECPVSMATTVNITTTTTTTTTTLPPHFLSHAYKGRASRSGCQIQNKAYNVGEEIKSASGPCLHCTCGGDGQMKCDPKACSPEPMLRQMIAAAESRRRR